MILQGSEPLEGTTVLGHYYASVFISIANVIQLKLEEMFIFSKCEGFNS